MNQSSLGPWVFHRGRFKFLRKFAEILKNLCLLPVLTTPADNLFTGVNDIGKPASTTQAIKLLNEYQSANNSKWTFWQNSFCTCILQGCWTRRQKNSTISSTSFNSSRKPSTSSSTSFNSPREGSPRPSTRSSSPRHPLAENEYSIAGHWIDGQNTEHRTLVLWRWRRRLQALGLFYQKNMPNNNTAYSICKINLSFISFLRVEQWSGGADVDSTHALAFSTTDTLKCVWTLLHSAGSAGQLWLQRYRRVVRILWILILKGIDSDERKT